MTRMEPDNKVELREVLRPLYLPLGQYLGIRKVFKIFMIHNYGIGWTLQAMLPNLESLKNGK